MEATEVALVPKIGKETDWRAAGAYWGISLLVRLAFGKMQCPRNAFVISVAHIVGTHGYDRHGHFGRERMPCGCHGVAFSCCWFP